MDHIHRPELSYCNIPFQAASEVDAVAPLFVIILGPRQYLINVAGIGNDRHGILMEAEKEYLCPSTPPVIHSAQTFAVCGMKNA